MLRSCFVVLLTGLVVMPAAADTRIRYVDDQTGQEQSAIAIKDGKMRMDNGRSSSWTLFDAKDDSLITVDPDDKTWTSLDEETMQKAAGQMSAAMAKMRAQLDQMPPEQRAMMEKMMGGMANTGKTMMQMKVDRTGKTLHKGGYDCQQVFVSVGNLSRSEMCVVDPNALDLPAADRKTLNALQARMKKFAESISKSFGGSFAFDFGSLGGIPVYMKPDSEQSGEVLKDVSHSAIDDEVFDIPKGYREKKLDVGG